MSNFKVIEFVKCPHCNGKGSTPRTLSFWERLLGFENTQPCYYCELNLLEGGYVVTRFVDLADAIKQEQEG